MLFSSLVFLYLFLPGTLLLYFIVPERAKNAALLLAGLVFYFCGAGGYVLLMLFEIALTYGVGLLLPRSAGKRKKALLLAQVAVSLTLLGAFKYVGLAAQTVNALLGTALLPAVRPALPVGISFYTFQCVSYAVDVYRGDAPAERDPVRFSLYISFFPQLIAGPIVRWGEMRPALQKREHSMEGFGDGAFRFVLGLGKKVLLADRLFAFCTAASEAASPSAALAWAGAAAYLIYVYFDFSGYSDMAVGLGRIFGFTIPENFDYPLVSRSAREFWRRWHITLGRWFRDYLYIPLGGSRRGLPRQLLNLLLVWALTGLWHGAGWNFALWGLSFGALVAAETLLFRKKDNSAAGKAGYLRTLPLLLVTVLIFVWFRFPTFGEAAAAFGQMFGGPLWSGETAYLLKSAAVLLVVAALGATPLPKRLALRFSRTKAGGALIPWGKALWMLLILAAATAYLVDGSFSPFLYFRF